MATLFQPSHVYIIHPMPSSLITQFQVPLFDDIIWYIHQALSAITAMITQSPQTPLCSRSPLNHWTLPSDEVWSYCIASTPPAAPHLFRSHRTHPHYFLGLTVLPSLSDNIPWACKSAVWDWIRCNYNFCMLSTCRIILILTGEKWGSHMYTLKSQSTVSMQKRMLRCVRSW